MTTASMLWGIGGAAFMTMVSVQRFRSARKELEKAKAEYDVLARFVRTSIWLSYFGAYSYVVLAFVSIYIGIIAVSVGKPP
jgi:hypothetical protein